MKPKQQNEVEETAVFVCLFIYFFKSKVEKMKEGLETFSGMLNVFIMMPVINVPCCHWEHEKEKTIVFGRKEV